MTTELLRPFPTRRLCYAYMIYCQPCGAVLTYAVMRFSVLAFTAFELMQLQAQIMDLAVKHQVTD